MTTEALGYISDCLESLSIPYEFMVWTQGLSFPYAVGEYTEIESINEDGCETGTFLLTVTTDKSFLILEEIKAKVKDFFPADGRTAILDNGSGIAVSYSSSFPVLTGEQGLNRIQINLNIKEWKGE